MKNKREAAINVAFRLTELTSELQIIATAMQSFGKGRPQGIDVEALLENISALSDNWHKYANTFSDVDYLKDSDKH